MRRGNHSKSRASKGLVLLLALVLVFGVAVGGTIAWLTAKSVTVTNTFTTSGIEITLTETGTTENAKSFKMIPGFTIAKDPKVTVTADSEDCYLFVKLVKSENFDTYLEYAIADGWTELPSEAGVYYREVAKGAGTAGFSVLEGDVVTVKDVTSTQMGKAVGNEPTLTVTAYACQLYNGNKGGTATKFDAEDAWTHAKTAAEPANP